MEKDDDSIVAVYLRIFTGVMIETTIYEKQSLMLLSFSDAILYIMICIVFICGMKSELIRESKRELLNRTF